MRHIVTPLALLTFGILSACGSVNAPVLANDAELYSGIGQSEWCEKNGYTPGSEECDDKWDAYQAFLRATGGTTERESDDPVKTVKYRGSFGGIKTVSTSGGTTVDDIDPDDFLHEWGIGMYGQQLDPHTFVLVDQFDPFLHHSMVQFDQPTEVWGISQHEAFDVNMEPLGFSEFLLHTNRGIFEMNDAVTPMVGTQFFLWTQW